MRTKSTVVRRTTPDLVDDTSDLDVREIIDGTPFDDAFVMDRDLSTKAIRELVIRRSILESISFAQCQLSSVRLRDVRFVRCDFSNAVIRGIEANRVEFVDCRLLGAKAIECRMDEVLLERCDARYAQFTGGVMRVSEFVETQLQEADLRGVNLEHTRWVRSDLSRADLTGANPKGADLRGANIDGMIVAAADVLGAIVNPTQAMELARLLGLIIR